MKIAITADVHLTSYDNNPERFHAFENILDQMDDRHIERLIIAGDLFDASCDNPAEFETLVSQEKFKHLTIHLLPGNHDPALSTGTFTVRNIIYLTEPELIELTQDTSLLFVPYKVETNMGEVLAAFEGEVDPAQWILIAHGDYLASTNLRNEYEPGSYMPLSRGEIQMYRPKKVFLGHIHLPFDSDILHYPGSPCGLDISETGIRSFLIYDTATNQVLRQPIETDVIFFQEVLTVLPLEDEAAYLSKLLDQRVSAWGLNQDQKDAVRARIVVQGYSSNREAVLATIMDYMAQAGIQLIEPPDLGKVRVSDDRMRAEIVLSVQERLEELGLPDDSDEPGVDDYILSAMSQVYGG